MKAIQIEDDADLIKKAIELLDQKIGHLNTMRFISLAMNKRIDSITRHRAYQKKLNKDQYLQDVFKGTV